MSLAHSLLKDLWSFSDQKGDPEVCSPKAALPMVLAVGRVKGLRSSLNSEAFKIFQALVSLGLDSLSSRSSKLKAPANSPFIPIIAVTLWKSG